MSDLRNSIDWIFFDVGGPLVSDAAALQRRIDTNLRVLRQYLPDLTRQQIIDLWPKASAINGSIDENLVHLLVGDPAVAKQAHDQIQHEKQKQPSYLETLVVRNEAASVCGELSKHYKLGLIANQHSGVKEILSAAGILQHFTHQKVSHDYGLIKPDPAYYQAVLSDTGANPLRSVMIDDNIERSLMPAKKFGMKTIWYKLEDRQAPPEIVDYTITKLEDLLEILL